MNKYNALELLAMYANAVQKNGREAANASLEKTGLNVEVCKALHDCVGNDGKLIKGNGNKVSLMDLMQFKNCV